MVTQNLENDSNGNCNVYVRNVKHGVLAESYCKTGNITSNSSCEQHTKLYSP